MKTGADAGNRSAVVVDHCEAKTDGEEKAGKVVEVERVLAGCGRERGLNAVPSNQDGGEGTEQVSPHRVEEAKILCEQVVDRLRDKLQEIGLHGQLLRRGDALVAAYGMRKFWRESVK